MIGIVLVTHTPLAAAFLAAATHVFKNVPVNLLALDVEPDQDVYGVSDLLAQALQEVDVGDGALILSDICGATPANCAAKMASFSPQYRIDVWLKRAHVAASIDLSRIATRTSGAKSHRRWKKWHRCS